jgi:hypothetical protein
LANPYLSVHCRTVSPCWQEKQRKASIEHLTKAPENEYGKASFRKEQRSSQKRKMQQFLHPVCKSI